MAGLQVGDVELYYERVGEGEQVVLTHGAWSDGRTWQAVTELLSDSFEVVTWDRRGHSRSQSGEGPGSVRQDAGDLAALVEHLAEGPVHVAGNSAGGAVVLNLVTMRPDLVKSAAAHEGAAFAILDRSDDPEIVHAMENDKRNIAKVEALIAAGENRQAARYFVEEVAVGPGAWEQFPPEFRAVIEANAPTVPDDLRDSFAPDTLDTDALATSEVPIMLTVGSASPRLEVAATRELSRLVPGADLKTIEGAGHIPHRTHPDDYVALLKAFMDRVAVGSVPER